MTDPGQQRNFELWHRDPGNWHMGVFYVNNKDPRIFVPKRNPMTGRTLNFGNPVSYLIIFALAIVMAALSVIF